MIFVLFFSNSLLNWMMQNQQLTIIPYLTTVCGLHAKKNWNCFWYATSVWVHAWTVIENDECHHQCMDICVMCDVNRKSREVVYKLNPSTIYISTEKKSHDNQLGGSFSKPTSSCNNTWPSFLNVKLQLWQYPIGASERRPLQHQAPAPRHIEQPHSDCTKPIS